MTIFQTLSILRARKGLILLTLAVTVATAVAVSLLMKKTYLATTTIVLNYKGVDPVSGLSLPAQLMPGYMATQVDIISSKSVALKVVETLGLAENPTAKKSFHENMNGKGDIRDWLAEGLLQKLDVVPSRESGVLGISFKDGDPDRAAAIANAFATEYQQISTQLKAEPMKKASAYFQEQLKLLREELAEARNRVTQFQQENEIESPDVASNVLIQNLRANLALAEAKLTQLNKKLTPNHPHYQAAQAEVDTLRSQLETTIKSTGNSVGNNARILERHGTGQRAAVDSQKEKAPDLNRAKAELTMLMKAEENAQRAYDAAQQRFSQTNLEGKVNQTDVAILSPASAPITPHSPKKTLNVLLSLFLGTILGLGIALIAEMFDRRVRTTKDIISLIDAPVLSVIKRKPHNPRRLVFARLSLPYTSRV